MSKSRHISATPPKLSPSPSASYRSPHHARMVAYKSSAVASFVKTPKPDCRAVLVYGPDAGLVTERADALTQVFARNGQGETDIVRSDGREFGEDPARLDVAARTSPSE